jgi:hypothetical protein
MIRLKGVCIVGPGLPGYTERLKIRGLTSIKPKKWEGIFHPSQNFLQIDDKKPSFL